MLRLIVTVLAIAIPVETCFAWSEGGHHLIAEVAFDLLTPEQQHELIEILKAHPRFSEDFSIPEKAVDPERWLIGRAAYWPDTARRGPFDRPEWHWELGPTLIIGNAPNVPSIPGACPTNATLESKYLHIGQAIQLARRTLRDKTHPQSDRALAICWLGHLVGDAHQPCHAGSLYSPRLFPEGDRGANSIATKQSRNLHALWDGLLGPKFDAGDVRRRQWEIESEADLIVEAKHAAMHKGGLDPLTWLAESREFGISHVYSPIVLDALNHAESASMKLETIDLPKSYLKEAGVVAQRRAAFAAERLAEILRQDLGAAGK